MELLSLERLSSICMAIRIWESPSIQNQLTNLYQCRKVINAKKPRLEFPHGKLWKGKDFKLITASAVELSNMFHLPLELKKNCVNDIRDIGEKIHIWMDYITETLEFDFKFAQKIYWKSDGTIDEDKIYKSWETDEEFGKQENLGREALYILACVTANEDFITQNQFEIETFLKKKVPNFNLNNYENKIYTLLALFLYLHYQYKKNVSKRNVEFANSALSEIISINPVQIIPMYEMLRMCITGAFTKVFYYIWDSCAPISEESLMSLVRYCKVKYKRSSMITGYYQDKSIELLIFLINQMTDDQKFQVFEKCTIRAQKPGNRLFTQIAPGFPNHEIIYQLINNHFPNFSKFDYKEVILFLLKILEGRKTKTKQFRELFHKIFIKIPSNFKEYIFKNINTLLLFNDLHCFKIVMNSMGENFKIKVIKDIKLMSAYDIKDGNCASLQWFIDKVLKPGEERNSFKKKFLSSICNTVPHVKRFGDIDKVLDILSETKEEKARLKKKIKPRYVCEGYMCQWRFDEVEKFLKWMFDSEEEIENLKISLSSRLFILDGSFVKFKSKMSGIFENFTGNKKDFLNFFFGLPEERESVENKEIYNNFRRELETTPIDESSLLRYSSRESVLVVKLNKLFIFHYFSELHNLSDIAHLFMNWAFKDEKRKNAVKEMYDTNEGERNFFIQLVVLWSVLRYGQSHWIVK